MGLGKVDYEDGRWKELVQNQVQRLALVLRTLNFGILLLGKLTDE